MAGGRLLKRWTPQDAAQALPSGTVWFFMRLTQRDIIYAVRRKPRGRKLHEFLRRELGWCSNSAIALAQMRVNRGDYRNGRWNLIHCGIQLNDSDGQRSLLEAVNPRVRRVPLLRALTGYPGAVFGVPLRHELDANQRLKLQVYADFVDDMPYNKAGLVGVLYNWGITGPDKRFCSQLVAEALQEVDMLPRRGVTLAGGKPRGADLLPSFWEPRALAMEAILDWDRVVSIYGRDEIKEK